jgi:hypothetical protein
MSLHRPPINRPLRPLISVIAVLLTVMSVALPVLFYNEIVALYQEMRASNSYVGVVLSQFDRSDVGTNPPSERIAYGETVSGTVTDDDGDHWHFIGSAGDIVTISLENTSSLDPLLELRNNYDLVVQDDDGGDGPNSLIADYTLPRDDIYLIVARGWNGDTGSYTLVLTATETRRPTNTPSARQPDITSSEQTVPPEQINDDDHFPDLPTNAMQVGSLPFVAIGSTEGANTINEPTTSCGSGVGSTIWFAYQPSNQEDIILTSLGSEFDTVLSVWTYVNDRWREIECNDDTDELTSEIRLSARAGMTYYIMLGGYSNNTGNFNLEISRNQTGIECYLRVLNNQQRVNLRTGAGTQYNISRSITRANGEFQAVAQSRDSRGSIWWRLNTGDWVRFDLVSERGDCYELPNE